MYTVSFPNAVRVGTLGVLLIIPLSLFAQTTTIATSTATTTATTSTPEPLPPPPPPVIDSRQAALQPIAQTRITNLAANVSNRLDASVRRLTNVALRLDSRITKMEVAGFEISGARNSYQEAILNLQAAELSLRTIDTEVALFVGSSDPRTAWLRLETIYGTITTQVVTAYAALRECVRQLEGATPTPTTVETSTSSSPE